MANAAESLTNALEADFDAAKTSIGSQPAGDGAMGASEMGFDGPLEVVVPRISVEAFCVSPAFATAMQDAVQDRRMKKAAATVSMGGVAKAVKQFQHNSTPNVLVIESAEGGFGMFGELEPLAGVCDEHTKVIVAGPSNDVSLYRELLRQGVSEYLVTPCSAMQVIESITTLYADPELAPAAKIIAVYGAKGGVGASTLAHNIAWAASTDQGKETVLIDFDLEFGTAALDFNVETKHSIADALVDIDGLDEVKLGRLLYSQNDKLKLLPSPASVGTAVEIDDAGVSSLIDAMRHSTDVIVLDLPHRWNTAVRSALGQANEVVLVATPDLASLRNMKTIFDHLSGERKLDSRPRVVLNQLGVQKRPEIPTADFADILGAPLDLEIAFDGALFGAAMNNGQMLTEVAASNKSVEALHAFVGGMFGQRAGKTRKPAAAASGSSSLLASLPFGSLLTGKK